MKILLLSILLSFACIAKDLDPRVTYHTDVVVKKLNQAEIYLKENKFKFAKQQLVSAQKKLNTIHKDYAGKFDINHPYMVDLKQRILYLESKLVVNITAESTPSVQNITNNQQVVSIVPPVVDAIDAVLPKVLQAVKEARFAVMALNSVEANYSQYRNQNKLKSVLNNLQNKLTDINAILPNAEMLVNSFRTQYPDQNSIESGFPRQASDLEAKVISLENNLLAWKKDRDRIMVELVSQALLSMKEAENSLKEVDVGNKTKLSVAIGHIQMWTINYYGYLMDAVALVYPEESKNRPEVLGLSSNNKTTIADAKQFFYQLSQLESKIAELNNQAKIVAQDKVKNARFPRDIYPIGKDENTVTKLLTQFFNVEPERLAVYAPWEERTVTKWINGIWVNETYKYLGVWMLKHNESGKYFVYQVTMRNKQLNNGNWGPMHYWTIGSSYEILKENTRL